MRALLIALLTLLAVPAQAQTEPPTRGVFGLLDGRQATPGGYYLNALPGEAITRVNVWGRVLRPGVYDVGPEFDLENVLSMAGVTRERILNPGEPQLVMRLFRAGVDEPVYTAPLDVFVRDPSPPELAYGDVIEIETEGVARVAVWGDVAQPGLFEVGPGFTSQDVVGLAGGPRLIATQPSQTRTIQVTVFREGGASPAYVGTLERFLSGEAPALADGDVIQIETALEQGLTTRDYLTIAGIITSGAIAVAQIISVTTR